MSYENFFFHVGTHKTASTYLQMFVFPRWPEVKYLRFRNLEYFLRLSADHKYLVSCEGFSGNTFARLEERRRSLGRLAEMFPGANAIIGFRPHGGFMASLYSQYLRYGGTAPFEDFFSLTASADSVIWRRDDLNFRTLIECLESSFGKAPFVFEMSELRTNPEGLLADMAAFLGTKRWPALVSEGKAQNVSLGRWQGDLLRNINRIAGVTHTPDGRNRPFPGLARWRLDPTTLCHRVLGRFPASPLVAEETRARIDEAYKEDWAFVSDYIKTSSFRHL